MRSIAIRHRRYPNSRKRLLVSVAICLALLAAVVGLLAARHRARNRDLRGPFAHQPQDERERRMAWTEVGAAADPPPAPPTVTSLSNRSLRGGEVSLNGTAAEHR